MTWNDLINLSDGTIVELRADVVNPRPDRRQRYDWRAYPTIPAGTRLRVCRRDLATAGSQHPERAMLAYVSGLDWRAGSFGLAHDEPGDLAERIAAVAEVSAETSAEWLDAIGVAGSAPYLRRVVARCLDAGTLTRAAVEDAIAVLDAEAEAADTIAREAREVRP